MEIKPTTIADDLWPRPFSQLQENIFFDSATGDLFLVADDGINGFLVSHPTPSQRGERTALGAEYERIIEAEIDRVTNQQQ